MNKQHKCYLASGWFSENQKRIMDKVRDIILEFPEIELFAPYYNGIALTKENDSPEMRKKVFDIDIGSIDECSLVVAVIDDFDPGTIFEMGYACKGKLIQDRVGNAFFGKLEKIPIIAYSDVSGRGLNVMLQQAVVGFSNGSAQLREQLRRFIAGENSANFLDFIVGDFI